MSNLTEAYRDDLRELVDALDDAGVFAPGEREAWDEGIDDADHMTTLMAANESLINALEERDGVEEVVEKHSNPETRVFA